MSVASASSFLDLLEKSSIVTPDRLGKLRESQASFPDAKSLAVRLVKDAVLTRWQAESLLRGNTKLAIGKYRLLKQLGAGRTGRVYLARHADMGRQAALKILPRRVDASMNNLQQFMAQARAVSSLDHPNLIHTFDVDSDADRFYLVMEHFPGEDLQSLIDNEGPLDFSRAADIVRQAAEGLAHAADKGLTHGDIRPSSIAVDATGRVKLLHLGVVELAGPAIKMLDKNDPASADYAAPEFTGSNATPESDIYSLGCVFYCLLTGKPPFDEGSFEDRRRGHQSIPPAAIVSRRPQTPPELAKICQRMMAKTPANRIGSAKEAAAVLTGWLQTNPLPAPAKEEKLRRAEPLPAAAAAKEPASASKTEFAPVANAAAVEEIPSFNFDKKRSKSPSTKPAPAKADPPTSAEVTLAGAASTPTPPAPAKKTKAKPTAKKPMDRRILIGLGAGGGVALLVGAALAVFAMRGDKAEVAQAETSPAAAQAATDTGGEEVLDEETLDGDLFSSSDDDEKEPAGGANADAAIAESAVAPPSETAAPDEQVAGASSPAEVVPAPADVAAPATAIAAETEAQPPAPTVEPATEATSGPPKAEPPVESPPPETPPAETAVAAAAPESEASPPDKPKAAEKNTPPAEPFADFPAEAVAIPARESGEASSQLAALATVHDDPEAGMFVRLIGGEAAHDGREIFTLEPDDPGFRNRSWTIFSGVGESGEKDRTAIARLTLDEQDQLQFQWTPEAAQQRAADYLRNCVLSINIGAKTKDFALRTPTEVEPLALSLEKSGARGQYEVEFAPPTEYLQLEITSLDGPFPKHNFVPGTTLKASGGKTAIMFGEAPNQVVMLEVRTPQMSRKLGINVVPLLNVNNRAVPFKPAELQQAAMRAQTMYQQMNNVVTAKIGPEKQRKAIEAQLPQQQALAQQFTEVAQNIDAWKEGGRVQFSLFFKVGDRKVDILKSAGGAPAPAGVPGESAKEKKPKPR